MKSLKFLLMLTREHKSQDFKSTYFYLLAQQMRAITRIISKQYTYWDPIEALLLWCSQMASLLEWVRNADPRRKIEYKSHEGEYLEVSRLGNHPIEELVAWLRNDTARSCFQPRGQIVHQVLQLQECRAAN
jgi:hypothetical protein